MLLVRCGVSLENVNSDSACDWRVLCAESNPALKVADFLDALSRRDDLHIFASLSAVQFFKQRLDALADEDKKKLYGANLFTCGVGAVTDHAARSLHDTELRFNVRIPDFGSADARGNGLGKTLELLENHGWIPRRRVHLWSKTWSLSQRILHELKYSRQWSQWVTQTHEIYQLRSGGSPVPKDLADALVNQRHVCLAVKSAEVLDAALAALLSHLNLTGPAQLPRNVQFSVWEKGALQRAQQLFLESRLIPWDELATENPSSAE